MAIQDYEDWIRRVYLPMGFISLNDTPGSYSGQANKSVVVNASETALEFSAAGIDDHSARHENGGADEISVTGLSGVLADKQDPQNHGSRHENGGADEISVGGLSGDLADAQDPKSHASSHKDAGADELDAAELGGALGASGNVLATNGDAAYWSAVSIGRSVLNTATGSTSGTLGDGAVAGVELNAYSFFPMIQTDKEHLKLSGHPTAATADFPRFGLHNVGSPLPVDYEVKWRYVA